jgi:hypothetical protein
MRLDIDLSQQVQQLIKLEPVRQRLQQEKTTHCILTHKNLRRRREELRSRIFQIVERKTLP